MSSPATLPYYPSGIRLPWSSDIRSSLPIWHSRGCALSCFDSPRKSIAPTVSHPPSTRWFSRPPARNTLSWSSPPHIVDPAALNRATKDWDTISVTLSETEGSLREIHRSAQNGRRTVPSYLDRHSVLITIELASSEDDRVAPYCSFVCLAPTPSLLCRCVTVGLA